MKKTPPSLPSPAPQSKAPPESRPDRSTTLTIPLKWISPSPTNPRKIFDDAKLQELAQSIKTKGVLQPILVRPTYLLSKKPDSTISADTFWREPANFPTAGYELVAGERRFRAAKLAGLESIEAKVRDLTDVEVLEVQVIENEQREDIPPLEKAEGYFLLLEQHKRENTKFTVETLAGSLGKSPATIYGLLKLRNLPEPAIKALADGLLPMSTAQLIGRIPSAAAQQEAVEFALEGYDGELYNSVRDVKEFIEKHCMVQLKGCSFDRKSLELVPSAGACTICPKMTGNNPTEYPGARADVCTDPACYRSKVDAHTEKLLARAHNRGQKVLEGDAAEKALRAWNSEYYDLASRCYEHPKDKTYKQLAGEEVQEHVVIAVKEGKAHELVLRKHVDPVLKEKHGIGRPAGGGGRDSGQSDQAKREKECKTRNEIGRKAIAAIVDQVESSCHSLLGFSPAHSGIFRALTLQTAKGVWAETRREVLSRHGVEGKDFGGADKQVETLIEDIPNCQKLFALWAELVLTPAFKASSYESEDAVADRKALCKMFSVDYAALDAQVRADHKAKAAAKKGRPSVKAAAQAHKKGNGHTSPTEPTTFDPCELHAPKPDSLDGALWSALRSMGGPEPWKKLRKTGATDSELEQAIADTFGIFGRVKGPGPAKAYAVRGGEGRKPQFFYDEAAEGADVGRSTPTLEGAELLAKARKLLNIKSRAEPVNRVAQHLDPNACRGCGCTEDHACDGGCYWVEPNLCSRCVLVGHQPETPDGQEAAAMVHRTNDSRKLRGAKV